MRDIFDQSTKTFKHIFFVLKLQIAPINIIRNQLLGLKGKWSLFQNQKPSFSLFSLNQCKSVQSNFFIINIDIFERVIVGKPKVPLHLIDETFLNKWIGCLLGFYPLDDVKEIIDLFEHEIFFFCINMLLEIPWMMHNDIFNGSGKDFNR